MTSNKIFGYQFRWLPIKVTSKWKKQEWWKHLTGKIPNAHVNLQDTFNTNLKHLYIIWDCVRAWALTLNSQNFIYTTKMKSINQNLYIFFLVNLSFYWLKSRAKERKKIVTINIKIKNKEENVYPWYACTSAKLFHMLFGRTRDALSANVVACELFRNRCLFTLECCTFTNSRQLVSTFFICSNSCSHFRILNNITSTSNWHKCARFVCISESLMC